MKIEIVSLLPMVSALITTKMAIEDSSKLRALATTMQEALNQATNPDPDFVRGFDKAILICRRAATDAFLSGSPIDRSIKELSLLKVQAERDDQTPKAYLQALLEAVRLISNLENQTAIPPITRLL